MRSAASQHVQIGLSLGITLAVGIGLLLVAPLLKALVPSPVHAPFPGAVLVAIAVRPASTGGLTVTRHYRAAAPFREVAEWYQGKDSLMPLSAVTGPGCFQQSFSRSPTLIPGLVRGNTTEEVTVCSTAGGVTVTSVTTTHFPVFVLRGLP
jgi:hypothetical protein